MKFNYTMKEDTLDNAITSLVGSAKTVRDKIHKLNVSVLNVWSQTNDVSVAAKRATRIVQEIDGRYAQAIVNWYTAFTPLVWRAADKEEDIEAGFYYEPNATKITKEEVIEAKGTHWDDFTPKKDPVPFDLAEEVEKFLARIASRANKGVEGDSIDPALHKSLRDAVSEYKQTTITH